MSKKAAKVVGENAEVSSLNSEKLVLEKRLVVLEKITTC